MPDQVQLSEMLPDLPAGWRPLRVARVADESSVIRSFYLEPVDGGPLQPAAAGQHLPIRLDIPGADGPVIRTYTISGASITGHYRLSVRKLGLASTYLHEQATLGTIIGAKPPAGDFIIDDQAQHTAVLVAAGVGITPMLAMLHHLVAGEVAGRPMRPAVLFYAARSLAERAFDAELAVLREQSGGKLRLVRLLQISDGAEAGRDHDETGFLDASMFQRHLSFGRHDFYLCGPPPFMQAAYGALRGLGVADGAIFAEAFGPASLQRTADSAAPMAPRPVPATGPAMVTYQPTGTEANWTPGAGSLLELAEAAGLKPEFGCREGACGACKSKLVQGEVAYFRTTSAAHGADEVLICSAVPAACAAGDASLVIALG